MALPYKLFHPALKGFRFSIFCFWCVIFSQVAHASPNQEKAAQAAKKGTSQTEGQNSRIIYGQFRGIRKEDEQALNKALNQIKNQNFEAGYQQLTDLGAAGSADAFFHLGEIERLGVLESGIDFSAAANHYRMAAALGHVRAGLALANMLYFDKGTNKKSDIIDRASVQTAIAAWQQLAIEGKSEALYMLGMLYWNGQATLQQDPIRGYGLVWQAANKGYRNAIRAEAQMLPELNYDARQAGRSYAQSLDKYGFSADILRIDLVMNNIKPAFGGKKRGLPVSWDLVWHLELGIALQEKEAEALIKQIEKDYAQVAGMLSYEIVPAPIRLTRFQLVMGPMQNMAEAVKYCMRFKKNGIDCYAMAPK